MLPLRKLKQTIYLQFIEHNYNEPRQINNYNDPHSEISIYELVPVAVRQF